MKDNKALKESSDVGNHKSSANIDEFEHIIETIGTHGRFQTIYKITFLTTLSIGFGMVYMNIIFALSVPDHWCTVPGREKTNLTLDEWRKLTLPTTVDNLGMQKYSKCHMFDVNYTESVDYRNLELDSVNITACRHGWSYDNTWFISTIATKEDWVCSKDLYVTNVFVFCRIAEVAGSFVLGQMGDIFGRRFIYYTSVISAAMGRILSIVTTSSYVWFIMFSGLAYFAINTVFQAPLVIGMEISTEQDRSTIVMYHSFGWSIGITVVSLLYWWVRDWESLMWISSVPPALILLFSNYFIESPRWLISKMRYDDAIVQFKKIAKINGRQCNITKEQLAKIYSSIRQETTYGIASLFDGWRLTRITSILGFIRCVVGISYFTIVLFGSSMSGNPFFIFFLQSLAEIPAYFMGKYFGDKFGRRFTSSVSLFVSLLACIPLIILSTDEKYGLVVAVLAAFIKLLNALTYFITSLQGMEFYPTCMRQTGIALGTILGTCASVLSPYLVYIGTTIDIRCPYYILSVLFILGTVLSLFVPETLHKKLPDTMEEARQFGINDKLHEPTLSSEISKLN